MNPVDQHPNKQDGFEKGGCRKEREGGRSKVRNARNEPMLAINTRLPLFPLTLGSARVLQENAAMLACLSKRKRGAQRALHRGRINLGARDRCLWNAPQHADAHELHPLVDPRLQFLPVCRTEMSRPRVSCTQTAGNNMQSKPDKRA